MATNADDTLDIRNKYKTTLNALIDQNYNVINDVYLDMFITHASGKHGEDYSQLLSDEFTFGWVERSLNKILKENAKSVNGFAFTCQLLALLTENPKHFAELHRRHVYKTVQDSLGHSDSPLSPSSKLAVITLYQSMLKHTAGIEWLKAEKAWKQAISYCCEKHTIYVLRRATQFITDLLFLNVADEAVCLEIIQDITRPLTDNVCPEDVGNIFVDCGDFLRKIIPPVEIITNILDRYIELNERSSIARHVVQTTKSQISVWKLSEMTNDLKIYTKILRCQVFMNFANFVDLINDNWVPDKNIGFDCTNISLMFVNNCRMCIRRNQLESAICLAQFYYALWKRVENRVSAEIVTRLKLNNFASQITLIQISPLIGAMHRNDACFPEFHDDYIDKLFKLSSEHTLGMSYAIRDAIATRSIDLHTFVTKAIQGIISIINILHRDEAVIVFQALCHILGGIKSVNDPKNVLSLMERPNLMSSVLTALHILVEKYRITWKESFEAIGLLNYMLFTLNDPNLTPKLAVEALKLAQISIEQFFAPNLALLVNTLSGSEIEQVGPMILKRLHDTNWECRDTSLELLSSMANISLLKFPAFQEHILSNNLCSIVVEIARNDSEFYVRASAWSCVSQMIPVALFWNKCFSSLDLISSLIDVVRNDDEGVVRKEAIAVITRIYEHQKEPPSHLESIYEIMGYAATHDLFWEVKLKAIDFWHSVIQRHLRNQGVMDGGFPPVTFSKESRKIVTLTQKEITSRLTNLLQSLSACGCLGVLLATLEDHDDLVVVRKGVEVIKSLADFMDRYHYYNELEQMGEQSPKVQTKPSFDKCCPDSAPVLMDTDPDDGVSHQPMNETESNETDSNDIDGVIQSIVSAQDVELLTKAYENQLKVDAPPESHTSFKDSKNYLKTSTSVTPHKFLQTIKTTDLNESIKVRTDWLAQTESFSSLLNDMMYSLEATELHDADCY